MSVYQRYTSREYDNAYFDELAESRGSNDNEGCIEICPLSGQFSAGGDTNKFNIKSVEDWLRIFPNAAYFIGFDETLFGNVVVLIYENLKTGKLSTTSITKFGVTTYDNLILDARSRFWPSCENLLPKYQKSNVRKCLAITNLKNYNKLVNNPGNFQMNKNWDETYAGGLANKMTLVTGKKPDDLGLKLLELGFLQPSTIQSLVMDVVYDNSFPNADEKTIEENNKLVLLIGDQLDQLFDSLLEYSPELLEFSYSTPMEHKVPHIRNNSLIDTIISELISVQTNFTMGLVNLLQNFIIPLRVHVLSAASSTGITKINQIFPPTIDEITRINCILHDSLNKAMKYGYVEIIKATGIIMPYFYKAFIRHEANLKDFTTKLNKFNNKNSKKIFLNSNINKGNFTVREIDSIVTGSLLELPKLKLISIRLNDAIISEKTKLRNFESELDEESTIIDKYFKSAIDVIDAFGHEESNTKIIDVKKRVFTPTGKILTELASNWPPELQYGWFSRKVVGIYEMRNIKPFEDNFFDIDILIIFSDHLLFLTIVDDKYYLRQNDQSLKSLSVSDILMHSLVNDKPLPSLSSLPSMIVSCWCDINEIYVSTYKGVSPVTHSMEEVLKFVNNSKSGFRGNNFKDHIFTKNYEILQGNGTKTNGQRIIQLVNRSAILNKKQPFHLFRSKDPKLQIYSIAQELSAYSDESSKSPVVLYLNLPFQNPRKYFDDNKNIQVVLIASFINDYQIQIVGYNRSGNFEMDEVISSSDFSKCLNEVLIKNYKLLFNASSDISSRLTQGYEHDLNYYVNIFTLIDNMELKKVRKERARNIKDDSPEKRDKRNFSENISIPEVYMNKVNDNISSSHESPDVTNSTQLLPTYEKNRNKKASHGKRNSIINKVFKTFRRSLDGSDAISKPTENKNIKGQKEQDSQKFNGNKNEYTELYKPSPNLKHIPPISSANIEDNEHKKIDQQTRDTSGTSGTFNSLDINSHFEFPSQPEPITLTESRDSTILIINGDDKIKQNNGFAIGEFPSNISEKGHKRSLTEENVLVLDRKDTCNQSMRTQIRKKVNGDYEKHVMEDYYKDGEANWVSISRENSSLLNENLKALKEEAHMNSEDIIDVHDSNDHQVNNQNDYDSEEDLDAVNAMNNQFVLNNNKVPFASRKKEISMQSLTPSQIVDEFSRQIDHNFMTNDINGNEGNTTSDGTLKSKINAKRFSTLTSSDEEFFSSDEFDHRPTVNSNITIKMASPGLSDTLSSDVTIINEGLEEKNLPEIPYQSDNLASITSNKHSKDKGKSLSSFSTDYESMTYLSEILNGNLKF